MFRRFSLIFLAMVLIVCVLSPAVFAADSFTAKFWVGKSYFEVNGTKTTMDAAPVILSGRTLIPLRYAANAVNVSDKDISWDSKTRKATVKKDGNVVVFTAGSKNFTTGGKQTKMDIAPVITKGRILLPLRYVAQALGVNCEYIAPSKMIIVSNEAIDTGVIDMVAAKNGTLAPPADAVSPTTDDGFSPAINSLLCTVGSKYAKVNGVTKIDLGTKVVVVGHKAYNDEYQELYPSIYNTRNTIDDESITYKGKVWNACYVPFIPVAEAWGVPEENMVWDGKHLAVFGYYGDKANYRVLTPGSRKVICMYIENGKRVVDSYDLNYPVYVRDNVLMLGSDTVTDYESMLFHPPGTVGLVNKGAGGGFDDNNGTAEMR